MVRKHPHLRQHPRPTMPTRCGPRTASTRSPDATSSFSTASSPLFRESFLAVWAELGSLAGSGPPALPWGSALISGSEPLNFKKSVMDAVGLPPVVQLMSMWRPTIESLRAQDAAGQESQNAQDA